MSSAAVSTLSRRGRRRMGRTAYLLAAVVAHLWRSSAGVPRRAGTAARLTHRAARPLGARLAKALAGAPCRPRARTGRSPSTSTTARPSSRPTQTCRWLRPRTRSCRHLRGARRARPRLPFPHQRARRGPPRRRRAGAATSSSRATATRRSTGARPARARPRRPRVGDPPRDGRGRRRRELASTRAAPRRAGSRATTSRSRAPLSALVAAGASTADESADPALAAAAASRTRCARAACVSRSRARRTARRRRGTAGDGDLAAARRRRARMDRDSDNFTAESCSSSSAQRSADGHDGGRRRVVAARARARAASRWAASRRRRLRPLAPRPGHRESLVAILLGVLRRPGASRRPPCGRSPSPADGTLENRLQPRPARGRVLAKTGTTNRASALSGFVRELRLRRHPERHARYRTGGARRAGPVRRGCAARTGELLRDGP